ncbi:MAG: cell division ATP-binding protein FtsE [Saccharofermentans sp.]|nr:cell division ATP-binding protein FtsE [Saccharofermentans sp.]
MIDFINVEKTYKSGVEALRGVNFTIEDGEFVFIIGKSGSGKSTLLKCITCEERPTSGKVTIDNFDISHMSRALVPVLRRKIGMIYQDFRLIETKTVAENVAFAGEIIGVPKKSLMNTVQICLSVVGLKDKADCYPQELSGGEQQRVAIARAMVNNPSLIVADEPTGNLDPETSEAIMAMLLEINRNGGTTVIICTHDSTMVDRMKQRVIEIEEGLISRDEKSSSYKGEQAEHEAYTPQHSRTDAYSGAGAVAFGDDEEYSDNFDDPDYIATKATNPVKGFVFGDDKKITAPSEIPVEEAVLPEHDTSDEEEAEIPDQVINNVTEVPVEEEVIPEEPEIIEINVPKEEPVAFGDEVKAAPVIPKEAYESVKTPANNLDPDIDTEDGIAFPNEEAEEQAKELKREQKRRQCEDKLAQKEAKRKEKLDKKKKVRRTDFKPGSDIDLFPEDDE